ncbi:UNVERIFIED_CONTAM: hypothetical protein GTU68_013845 [Idotea baltica]|nr:hypothetical protein [Idotea baltica]
MSQVSSTCPYCGVGCGVEVSIAENSDLMSERPLVLGAKKHPANFGRLCSKGSALAETLFDKNNGRRLTHPRVGNADVSWDEATKTVAKRIADSIQEHGKDSVAFYLSGQLLTEDYYVANKLMKGFIGTANVDTNSRLCMSSAVAGYKRAFGSDSVPCCYEDIELADLIVLVGSNAAWTHPVLYQRMVAAKETNPNLRIVLIDPRKTASDDLADLHLPLAPSSDGFLFQGLLSYLIEHQAIDKDYIDEHTDGFALAATQANALPIDTVLERTLLQKDALLTFYSWFAETKKTVSFYSQGVNQSATGTDKCNAIINCHLATGKIGYAGAGPFSITGQPNAMGGREVGGLANQLAAHMDFAPGDVERVKRFWQSPTIATEPGLKAVELFDAIDAGQIKVLWIMATNPAVSLPNSNKIRQALSKCETVIVSDVTHTDTTQYADITLPALAWSEKNGTVTNSERCISRQRSFCNAPGLAKADWWALTEVAKKLGYGEHFQYQSPKDVFVEHAQLSAYENNGTRSFDISGLSQLGTEEYDNLVPIQWPVNEKNPQGTTRLFEDGKFFTSNERAQFISSTPILVEFFEHDFVLNTGRLRDQWHTMSRTGKAESLTGHDDVPIVQIHLIDAKNLGLNQYSFAELYNDLGRFIAQVDVTNTVTQGQLYSPIHWNDQFASDSVVSKIVSPEVDPISGQPESKASGVSIKEFKCVQWAKIVSREPISKGQWAYWAESKTKQGYVTLVGCENLLDWQEWLRDQLRESADQIRYTNPIAQSETLIGSSAEQVELLILVDQRVESLPSFIWLEDAFDTSVKNLKTLLRGEMAERDALICGCFRTSRKKITSAIQTGSNTQQLLADSLGCGSKCGSCRPELNQLLLDAKSAEINI